MHFHHRGTILVNIFWHYSHFVHAHCLQLPEHAALCCCTNWQYSAPLLFLQLKMQWLSICESVSKYSWERLHCWTAKCQFMHINYSTGMLCIAILSMPFKYLPLSNICLSLLISGLPKCLFRGRSSISCLPCRLIPSRVLFAHHASLLLLLPAKHPRQI